MAAWYFNDRVVRGERPISCNLIENLAYEAYGEHVKHTARLRSVAGDAGSAERSQYHEDFIATFSVAFDRLQRTWRRRVRVFVNTESRTSAGLYFANILVAYVYWRDGAWQFQQYHRRGHFPNERGDWLPHDPYDLQDALDDWVRDVLPTWGPPPIAEQTG